VHVVAITKELAFRCVLAKEGKFNGGEASSNPKDGEFMDMRELGGY